MSVNEESRTSKVLQILETVNRTSLEVISFWKDLSEIARNEFNGRILPRIGVTERRPNPKIPFLGIVEELLTDPKRCDRAQLEMFSSPQSPLLAATQPNCSKTLLMSLNEVIELPEGAMR